MKVKPYQKFAKYYDLFYSDKDYKRECDFIVEVVKKYGRNLGNFILDSGCGTGNHALLLVERGFKVIGVDISNEMILRARNKVKIKDTANVPEFMQGDMKRCQLNQKFDVCISMFNTLSYQIKNQDVLDYLTNIKRHLLPGGLLIADFWYGPTVLRSKDDNLIRIKRLEFGKDKLIRIAETTLDTFHHIGILKYQFIAIKDSKIVEEFSEIHPHRFFFPQEIILFAEMVGFDVIGLFPGYGLERKIEDKDWECVLVAKV